MIEINCGLMMMVITSVTVGVGGDYGLAGLDLGNVAGAGAVLLP